MSLLKVFVDIRQTPNARVELHSLELFVHQVGLVTAREQAPGRAFGRLLHLLIREPRVERERKQLLQPNRLRCYRVEALRPQRRPLTRAEAQLQRLAILQIHMQTRDG